MRWSDASANNMQERTVVATAAAKANASAARRGRIREHAAIPAATSSGITTGSAGSGLTSSLHHVEVVGLQRAGPLVDLQRKGQKQGRDHDADHDVGEDERLGDRVHCPG